jgi:hypothetical protein
MNTERKVSLGYLVFKGSKVSDDSPNQNLEPLMEREHPSNISNFSIDTLEQPERQRFNWRKMFVKPLPRPRKVFLNGTVHPLDE